MLRSGLVQSSLVCCALAYGALAYGALAYCALACCGLGCSASATNRFTGAGGSGSGAANGSGASAGSGASGTGADEGNGGSTGVGFFDGGLPDSSGDTNCSAATQLVYTLTADNVLYSFDPPTLKFTMIGTLDCATSETPYSMAVDRNANAWSVFTDGSLWQIDTSNAHCTATTFVPGQHGWSTFGMGFSADTPSGNTDTLYVSDSTFGSGTIRGLAKIDLATMTLTPIGMYSAINARGAHGHRRRAALRRVRGHAVHRRADPEDQRPDPLAGAADRHPVRARHVELRVRVLGRRLLALRRPGELDRRVPLQGVRRDDDEGEQRQLRDRRRRRVDLRAGHAPAVEASALSGGRA
jgi:hypothetical protein